MFLFSGLYSIPTSFPKFGQWEFWKWYCGIFLSFFEHFLTFCHEMFQEKLDFQCPNPESTISPKNLGSFNVGFVFRNQGLGVYCAHCCPSVSASRASWWTEPGHVYIHACTHIHTCTHVYPWVCISGRRYSYGYRYILSMSSHWYIHPISIHHLIILFSLTCKYLLSFSTYWLMWSVYIFAWAKQIPYSPQGRHTATRDSFQLWG